MPYADNAVTFLIHTLIGLYILIIMLRFLFQLVHADFYNPLSQFVVRATNPPLVWLRRIVPGLGGIDLSAVLLMLVLQFAELWAVFEISGRGANAGGLLVLSFAELLNLAVNVFFFSILIQVVLSWVNPGTPNPITSVLYSLNEPLLAPARRLVPAFSGLDLSPLVVMIVLKLCEFMLIDPIRGAASALM